jgi:dehydrogenase/reductase SDR family protein 1
MVAQGRGLIVNISSHAAAEYSSLFGVTYGVAKAALDRMTADMARELEPHGVAVVSLWPGPIKGEKILARPDRVPPEVLAFILAKGESPQFTGRAVAALAADPRVLEKTGRAFRVAALAAEYGFSDPGVAV